MLQGQSVNGSAIDLLSNPQLSFVPSVANNSAATQGAKVGQAIVDPSVQAALQAGATASSIDRSELGQLSTLQGPVVAPVSGIFALVGGRPMLEAPGVDVTVGLLPLQYLRYQAIPFSGQATIETVVGQQHVPCAAVWVEPVDPSSSTASSGMPYVLDCRLPRYVETAAGLTGQVTLSSPTYSNVVVVPNLYIGYDTATDGYFVNISVDGKPQMLPISVGITDGVVSVVTSAAPLGATLLPVPAG